MRLRHACAGAAVAGSARAAGAPQGCGLVAARWNAGLGAMELGPGAGVPGRAEKQAEEPGRALPLRLAPPQEAAAAPGSAGGRRGAQLLRHRQPGRLVYGHGHLLCQRL